MVKKKMPQVCFFLFICLATSYASMPAAWLCFLLFGWEMLYLIRFFRYFCPFFFSPASLLSHCFATALFNLFIILPLSSPLQYPVHSLFFSLTNSLLWIPSPFLSPLEPPPLSHPSSALQPPYIFLVSFSSSVLRCSCWLCWHSEAEGGGRRPS